jgi:catechol 2,3-dioxygenase-like lactoylglutathione lyase family enzyme
LGAVFDHVTIRVADREVSEALYTAVLAPLGIDLTYSTSAFAEWREFSLTQADAEHPVTRNLHVGFVAPSREQVDEFWRVGQAAGATDDGAPGPRDYTEGYYGAFLRDPDGNSIEAVHYDKVNRHEMIDHLWIRVADVAAAAAFYDVIAPSAGLHARPNRDDEHATFFDGRDAGGSFTLVAGDVLTEHVHLAFGGDEDAVRRFHADATAAGYRSNGAPGERPQYHPGYYAAYVLDADGHNIEVVDHHR